MWHNFQMKITYSLNWGQMISVYIWILASFTWVRVCTAVMCGSACNTWDLGAHVCITQSRSFNQKERGWGFKVGLIRYRKTYKNLSWSVQWVTSLLLSVSPFPCQTHTHTTHSHTQLAERIDRALSKAASSSGCSWSTPLSHLSAKLRWRCMCFVVLRSVRVHILMVRVVWVGLHYRLSVHRYSKTSKQKNVTAAL